MKIKQIVLISLVVFGLGFMSLLIAGFALPEGSSFLGNTSVTTDSTADSEGQIQDGVQIAEDGTPVITPHGDPDAAPQPSATTSSPAPSSSSAPAQSGTGSSTTSPSTPKPASPSGGTTTTTTPKPPSPTPKPPAAGCGSPGGVCTSAEVAKHNSASDCWVIYNGGYYEVTPYVTKHKVRTVFNSSTCGKDITGYLNGSLSTAGEQHPHKAGAYTTLNGYYVGKVQ